MPDTSHEDGPSGGSGGSLLRRVVAGVLGLGVLPLALAAGVGTAAGLGVFTFGYGDGAAYLSDDPEACANCHVMDEYYDSWQASGHHHVAVCNDCHLPPGFVGKWVTKLDNGFFHSLAFTTGGFDEPIDIKPRNRRVTQQACQGCHGDVVDTMKPVEQDAEMLLCVQCHSDVGHALRR